MADWQEEYQKKVISAEKAASLVKSGDHVVFSTGREASTVGKAIAARKDELKGVRILVPSPVNNFGWYDAGWEESFEILLGMPTFLTNKMIEEKIAEKIAVTRSGNEVHGLVVRNGYTIIEIKGTLVGEMEERASSGPHFVIKSILDEQAVGPRKNPLLLRQVNPTEFPKMEYGEGTLTLGESKYDYLHELPIDQMMMIMYMENGTVLMPPGKVVAEIDADKYAQYHGIKYDWVI